MGAGRVDGPTPRAPAAYVYPETGLRLDDSIICAALFDGPKTTREISAWIVNLVRGLWSERNGYDFEWDTDEEPLGARLLAHCEARADGVKLLPFEIHPRLRSLERRGIVERIQIEGRRPMLWKTARHG